MKKGAFKQSMAKAVFKNILFFWKGNTHGTKFKKTQKGIQ